MGHLDKVAPAVQKFVDEVKAMGGSKKKIDTQAEYDKLQEYLTGNASNMNKSETEFINGFMIEYTSAQEAKKAAEEAENVTEATRDFAKAKAKLMGNKKRIDTEAEARELLRYLNSDDLKPADKQFIEDVLRNSGYGDLLEDRVGALEQRVKVNENRDDMQDEWINENRQEIEETQKTNEEQSTILKELAEKAKNGEDIEQELRKLINEGKITDEKLKKAIDENTAADHKRYLQDLVYEWGQNHRIGQIERRVP